MPARSMQDRVIWLPNPVLIEKERLSFIPEGTQRLLRCQKSQLSRELMTPPFQLMFSLKPHSSSCLIILSLWLPGQK
jgi:hypothetical protein